MDNNGVIKSGLRAWQSAFEKGMVPDPWYKVATNVSKEQSEELYTECFTQTLSIRKPLFTGLARLAVLAEFQNLRDIAGINITTVAKSVDIPRSSFYRMISVKPSDSSTELPIGDIVRISGFYSNLTVLITPDDKEVANQSLNIIRASIASTSLLIKPIIEP